MRPPARPPPLPELICSASNFSTFHFECCTSITRLMRLRQRSRLESCRVESSRFAPERSSSSHPLLHDLGHFASFETGAAGQGARPLLLLARPPVTLLCSFAERHGQLRAPHSNSSRPRGGCKESTHSTRATLLASYYGLCHCALPLLCSARLSTPRS